MSTRFPSLSKLPIIAIVDDDASMREAFCDLLQSAGYLSRAFADAPSFLAEHAGGRFDLLITDIRMPGIDGLELQRRLRAIDSALPVIVVTSFDDAATRARALGEGAAAYLTKPVAAEDLFRQIDRILDRGDPSAGG